MPYRGRQAPLILERLGIACLSGPNGAGKSSLLDAITWALWGRSRAGSSADHLVAAQMSDMSVQLEFRSHGTDYRVERKHRRRKGGGGTTFDFQMRDGDRWRSLNERNVTETGKKLVDTIRLDYDTFINSAFLVQGKADLFVSQRPAERKRILGEILNLSAFERYAQRARDTARDDRGRQAVARGRIEAIDRELEREDGLKQEAEKLERSLTGLRARLKSATERRDELTAIVAHMETQKQALTILQSRLAELSAEVDGLTAQRDELQTAIAKAEAILARGEEIEAGWRQLQETRSDLTALGQKARVHSEMVMERSRLEQKAADKRAQLTQDVVLKEHRNADLAAAAAAEPALQEKLSTATSTRTAVKRQEVALGERREQRDRLNGEIEAKRALYDACRTEYDAQDQPLALITQGTHVECPVCGTQLGEHGVDRLRNHFRERKDALRAQMEGISAEGKSLVARHGELTKELEQDEKAVQEELSRITTEAGALDSQLERAQAAAAQLTDAAMALDESRAALSAFTADVDEVRAVQAQLAEIDYDPKAHTLAQERESSLRQWEDQRRELDVVTARVDRERAARADVMERLESRATLVTAESTRAAVIEVSIAGMNEIVSHAQEATDTTRQLAEDIRAAEQNHVRVSTELALLADRRAEKTRLHEEEQQTASRASVYDELAQAFGPRGVQALLIETALPELEDDANDLLGRITNGAMTLRLETQRTTQAGTTVETLDVIIADGLNTRAYEMYSGGEAFRINFALRIALSKLLARRAGAEVPVLFIDEGFGSQDTEGRERLIQAISALWSDPAFHDGLILVITHIDDVRNQFDTRIDVVKTENGSRYSLAT